MTLTNVSASLGLQATGTPTGTKITGGVTIGHALHRVTWTDADIVYSFKVTNTGASDEALLTTSSGVVTQVVGTPTIVDGDGKDFEGVTLPTMVTLYGVYMEAASGNSEKVGMVGGGGALPDVNLLAGAKLSYVATVATPSTFTFTYASNTAGDNFTVTVIGRSS